MNIFKELPNDIQRIIYNEYLEKQREYHINNYNNIHNINYNHTDNYEELKSQFKNLIIDIKLWFSGGHLGYEYILEKKGLNFILFIDSIYYDILNNYKIH